MYLPIVRQGSRDAATPSDGAGLLERQANTPVVRGEVVFRVAAEDATRLEFGVEADRRGPKVQSASHSALDGVCGLAWVINFGRFVARIEAEAKPAQGSVVRQGACGGRGLETVWK